MKIAIVSPYDWSFPGGVRQHISDLSDYLEGQGHEVHILTAASVLVSEQRIQIIGRAFSIAINGSVARPGIPSFLRHPAYRHLVLGRYDLVHVHEPLAAPLTMACVLAAQTRGIPCIGTFHTAVSQFAAWLYAQARPVIRPVFEALAERIAVSTIARSTIEQIFPASYHIIPNGVAVERFTSAKRMWNTKKPTVLFLGRLEPRKGVNILLEAIPLVRHLASEAGDSLPRFIIAGDGPERDQVQQYALEENDVVFTGALQEEEKAGYFASADIFCAPSLGGESQGIVLLEAMAAGAAVVASDIPGYCTVINHEQNGLLVSPHNSQQLAQGIHSLLHDNTLRARLALWGQKDAQRYAWSQIGHEIEMVYAAALTRPSHVVEISKTDMPAYVERTRLSPYPDGSDALMRRRAGM
jgi:phosphatidyl-myo-inositol alpha-mannosyltransferase